MVIMAMTMAKKVWVYGFVIVVAGFSLTYGATTYFVGDSSGWDISTDLDTWSQDKRFFVDDVLVFQFSSSESLNEVTREDFNSCNTANVLKTYPTGNTTVTLSQPGHRFFISGNRLYCLGGMKLQVNVENNQTYSPAAAPQPPTDALPRPSSKSDNDIPRASAGFVIGRRESTLMLVIFLCYVISTDFGV